MKIINKPKKRTSDLALFPILKIYKKNGAAIKKEIIKPVSYTHLRAHET